MHILHVIDTLEFGGAEKVLVSMANAASARHQVSVCCIRRSGPLARELDPRIEVFTMGKGEGDEVLLPLRLAHRISDRRPDVVHTHNWAAFIEGGIAARRARVGVRVHTVHGPYSPPNPGWIPRAKRSARHAIERSVAGGFSHIVAVSDAIREYIPKTVGIRAHRLTTIHNGIADRPLPPRDPTGGALTFVTVGRLDAVKNQTMMLQAFARVAPGDHGARLVVVGDGPQRTELQTLADRLRLADRIEFTGFREDVTDILANADVFLLSSHYEGISIALLEAMRAGLPAVCTRVGGVAETIVDRCAGLLVADDDVAAFADAMTQLAGDAAMRLRFGSAARKHQRDEFSLERMVQRYEALYFGPALNRKPAWA